METEVINTPLRLQEIRGDWKNLFSSSPGADVFLSPEWLLAWWDVFSAGRTLFFVALWEERTLCALAPFFTAKKGPARFLHFAGHPNISDRMDVLLFPGREEECVKTLAQCLRDRNEWDMMHLRQFSPLRGNAERLGRALRDIGFRTVVEDDGLCRYVDLKQYKGYDDFVNRVLGKHKQNFSRKARRLTELEDVRWEILRSLNDRHLEEMIELDVRNSVRGKIGKSYLQNPLNAEFLKKAVKELGEDRFMLDAVRIKGELVSYQLYLVTDKGLGAYQSAYHMDYGKLGVGVQTMMKGIEHGFEWGHDEFDFLLGDEDYKAQYSPLVRANKRLRVYRGGPRSLFLRLYHEWCLSSWRWARKQWRAWKKKSGDSREKGEE